MVDAAGVEAFGRGCGAADWTVGRAFSADSGRGRGAAVELTAGRGGIADGRARLAGRGGITLGLGGMADGREGGLPTARDCVAGAGELKRSPCVDVGAAGRVTTGLGGIPGRGSGRLGIMD